MSKLKQQLVRQLIVGCIICLFMETIAPAWADQKQQPDGTADRFHLYLNAHHGYTDNLFFTSKDEESDIWLTITPGIWFATPGLDHIPLEIETAPRYSSGTPFFEPDTATFENHRLYLRYQPTLDIFADNDSENSTHHLFEGMFQYRFGWGPQLSVINRFDDTRELWNRGVGNRAKDYQANLFQIKTLLADDVYYHIRLDYANYALDFKERDDAFRDRTDNRLGLYYGLKFTPKKILFAEYTIIQSRYEKDIVRNNEDRRGAFGVDWKDTLNTSGRLNIGLQMQRFKPKVKMVNLVFWELLVNADLTPRHQLRFWTVRQLVETDVAGPDYVESTHADFAYRWQFSNPMAFELSGAFTRDLYQREKITLDGRTDLLDNTILGLKSTLFWQLSKSFELSASYKYKNRDSNFKSFDYTANEIVISLNYNL